MGVPDSVKQLVENFHRNVEAYKSGQYNETQARVQFIDPLFIALGWDVRNEKGYAEAYKDVVHEDAIKVGATMKAPDYCFRIGGARKFFLEAKKPSVRIKEANDPAYQLRRYAWSAKLPLSILTDFEEFAVYDCRLKPAPTDAPSKARTLYITYADYESRWEEIEGTFSKTAVLHGSFDKYAEDNKRKKGTAEVDDAFLAEIEEWRETLAKEIWKRNKANLSVRELNEAVQTTIDRIIFLRICEDRGIEPYQQLQGQISGPGTYERLKTLFHRADDRYNSGLFHFKKERGREQYDNWTLKLEVDDKPLKDIIKRLYYPDSPYEFSVLPADILGQVYEQFLGKVIEVKGQSVKVEEKPEVKKAGGVYYTPTYIVDYIVSNTVGKMLESLTPEEAAGKSKKKDHDHPIRVLDPACGSGSFLLGAYQFLLDWYLAEYAEKPQKHLKGKEPQIVQIGKGDAKAGYRLTTHERKRILLDHIYGVDIDAQAVETTKLSLLLKVLEGETTESIQSQLSLFHTRALPDLDNNIKCGNSLIGTDFYAQTDLELTEEDRYRVNPFDWDKGFPSAFDSPNCGFDVAIGNPPYIRIQSLREIRPQEADFYSSHFRTAAEGNFDIYVLFVERCLTLLRMGGRLGFILPHKFFNAKYGIGLRNLLHSGSVLERLVHFGDQQVFAKATTYTCLMFLLNSPVDQPNVTIVRDLPGWKHALDTGDEEEIANSQQDGSLLIGAGTGAEWGFHLSHGSLLIEKFRENTKVLADWTARIFQGLKTGADKVYIVRVGALTRKTATVFSPATDKSHRIEASLLRPLIKGGDSARYHLQRTDRHIIFPYEPGSGRQVGLISPLDLQERFPYALDYFKLTKRILDGRERGRWSGPTYYQFSRSQALEAISDPKIFTPDIAPKARYSIDPRGEITFTGGAAGGYGITLHAHCPLSAHGMLALLNSCAVDWYHRQCSTAMRGGWYSYEARFIREIPMPAISELCSSTLDSRGSRMVDLHSRLVSAKTQHDKSLLQRQIEATDAEIDRLVYELYGLTEAEIKLVEEGTK